MSLIEPLDQGVMRTFQAHYTVSSMARNVSITEESPHREKVIEVWKDETTDDAIIAVVVGEEAGKEYISAGGNWVQMLCRMSWDRQGSQAKKS